MFPFLGPLFISLWEIKRGPATWDTSGRADNRPLWPLLKSLVARMFRRNRNAELEKAETEEEPAEEASTDEEEDESGKRVTVLLVTEWDGIQRFLTKRFADIDCNFMCVNDYDLALPIMSVIAVDLLIVDCTYLLLKNQTERAIQRGQQLIVEAVQQHANIKPILFQSGSGEYKPNKFPLLKDIDCVYMWVPFGSDEIIHLAKKYCGIRLKEYKTLLPGHRKKP